MIRIESAEVTPGLHGAAAEEESTGALTSLSIGGNGGCQRDADLLKEVVVWCDYGSKLLKYRYN